jgi:hypothetical protein
MLQTFEVREVAEADGTTRKVKVTYGEEILERMRQGRSQRVAAGSVGVTFETLLAWRKLGAAARSKEATGQKLTADEVRYRDFSLALDTAEAEAEHRLEALLDLHAQGGLVIATERIKTVVDAQGNEKVVERTVTRESALPNTNVLKWLLERRFGPGRRVETVEVTGRDGKPIEHEVRVGHLVEALRSYKEGQAELPEVTGNGNGSVPHVEEA